MPEIKKLLLLRIDNDTYEKLKHAARDSRRVIGNELALRLAYAMHELGNSSKKEISKHKLKVALSNQIIQILISLELHSTLKTMAAASGMLLKDFTLSHLVHSLDNHHFVLSADKAIINEAVNTKKVEVIYPPILRQT